MSQNPSPTPPSNRFTRRSAAGRLGGAGVAVVFATANHGLSRAVARAASPHDRTGVAATQEGPAAMGSAANAAPTVVLVHGAFAESSSWNGVIDLLLAEGRPVVSAANPLRSLAGDAAAVASLLASIDGPVVLVGHSYGGMVVTEAAANAANVAGLVYVCAFAPEAGETAFELSGRFPGSTLGAALAPPVALPDGGQDLYIRGDTFHAQFAEDVPDDEATRMYATQRPVTAAALNDAAGEPAWTGIPSWFVYGERDLNIPAALHAFMAERAGARETVAIPGGSHVVMISQPRAVADVILAAIEAVA